MNTFYTNRSNSYGAIVLGNIETGSASVSELSPLDFKDVTHDSMKIILPFLSMQESRTTDFSLGGILMWVDVFKYQYCVYRNTLFIKGVMEDDFSKTVFSVPLGELPLAESVRLLKEYCIEKNIPLEFSAVPESEIERFRLLDPKYISELEDWADYLYDAEMLATLKGKKMAKKRNHVNRFMADYHDHLLLPFNKINAERALEFMNLFDLEGDSTPMAVIERNQTRKMIREYIANQENIYGAFLIADGAIAAFTMGDIIGDTLFIHIEKALREYNGSYETINMLFAKYMMQHFPQIKYINREDDSGDDGLRKAKMSYHPLSRIRKYNVIF